MFDFLKMLILSCVLSPLIPAEKYYQDDTSQPLNQSWIVFSGIPFPPHRLVLSNGAYFTQRPNQTLFVLATYMVLPALYFFAPHQRPNQVPILTNGHVSSIDTYDSKQPSIKNTRMTFEGEEQSSADEKVIIESFIKDAIKKRDGTEQTEQINPEEQFTLITIDVIRQIKNMKEDRKIREIMWHEIIYSVQDVWGRMEQRKNSSSISEAAITLCGRSCDGSSLNISLGSGA